MTISYGASLGIIFASSGLGLAWGYYNWLTVKKVNLDQQSGDEGNGLRTRMQDEESKDGVHDILSIGQKIKDGAKAFLHEEYKFCSIMLAVMALIVYFAVDSQNENAAWRPYVAISFLVGGFTSMVCGYISMMIATESNYRVSHSAKSGLSEGFKIALAAGCSMGFILVSIALAMITILIVIYKAIHVNDHSSYSTVVLGPDGKPQAIEDYIAQLFEFIAGFGLGGSTVGLFGRVGGGIYTKAADVGADLVGKVEQDLPEDSPRNPATIADNVGDNVGDVAGMGADLFGSFAESTCAALVVSGHSITTSDNLRELDTLLFPLIVSAFGILCCIIVSFYGVYINKVEQESDIESSLKKQLLFSSILITPAVIGAAFMNLPNDFLFNGNEKHSYQAFICVLVGLWAGLAIGYITEYMTSHSYSPVREVAESCKTGAATNIIYGLALGYLSTIVPIFCIAISAYVSLKLLGYYGVALAALGMLSNLCIGLAIDGYGPISDNAGGIAEMAEMGEHIRKRTDALDAAGNTTAAIGKGFAIGSAALVSLSLFGGFLTNASAADIKNNQLDIKDTQVVNPLVFAFLLVGAMLPYAFSAFTMKSVGKAALEMVEEIRRQIRNEPGILTGDKEPDYQSCIAISTKSSLKEMIAPGALVILSPILTGIFFGPVAVAGLLPGALVSGVQMAISSSNTGGAWDNAKKYIEGGNLQSKEGVALKKGSEEHKAAVIGDTVGDPLKDTSGPALNILVKLMAILSLVFARFFCLTSLLTRESLLGTD
ncbi:hypothetical protein ABPG74_006634 [Tetrahymena malaccensis]